MEEAIPRKQLCSKPAMTWSASSLSGSSGAPLSPNGKSVTRTRELRLQRGVFGHRQRDGIDQELVGNTVVC